MQGDIGECLVKNFGAHVDGNCAHIGSVCSKHILHVINLKLENNKLP